MHRRLGRNLIRRIKNDRDTPAGGRARYLRDAEADRQGSPLEEFTSVKV